MSIRTTTHTAAAATALAIGTRVEGFASYQKEKENIPIKVYPLLMLDKVLHILFYYDIYLSLKCLIIFLI